MLSSGMKANMALQTQRTVLVMLTTHTKTQMPVAKLKMFKN